MAPNDSKSLWDTLGLGPLQSIKMGPGVVGRTSSVVIFFVIAAIFAMWVVKTDASLVLIIFAVLAAIVFGFIGVAFWYATKFPHHSVMENSSLSAFLKVQQSASSPEIIDLNANPTSNDSPPLAITTGEK